MRRREIELWLEAAREDLVDAEEALERERWFRAAFLLSKLLKKYLKLFSLLSGERNLQKYTL